MISSCKKINKNVSQSPTMKKIILLFLLTSIFWNNADSQITRENWLIGGAASYSSLKNKGNGIPRNYQIEFQLSGNVGYFFLDKFVGGLKPVFESNKVINGSIAVSSGTYELGPFLRYYFLPADRRVNILSEFSYEFGITPSSGNPTLYSNNISGLIGCEAFFNQSVGVEFTIGYSSLKYTKSTGSVNTIIAGIGFQFHLEKDN
jgi:hypothetical protein